MIQLRVLGSLDLRDVQGQDIGSVLRQPKLVALLLYLAGARPRGFHRRDTLIGLLWPELDHTHARNALRQAIHALRKALGREILLSRGDEELALDEQRLWCDAREFATALAAQDPERALEVYRGELASGLYVSAVPEFERWIESERDHVRRQAIEAAQTLIGRDDAAGNAVGAARWVHRWLALSPYDEAAAQELIRRLDRLGDRAGAIQAYEDFERRLARDLELQPSPDTHALVTAIRVRQGSPSAARTQASGELGGYATSQERKDAREEPPPAERTETERDVPFRVEPTQPARRERSAAPHVGTRLVIAVALSAAIVGAWILVGGGVAVRGRAADSTPVRLVVLPFANLGPAEDDYFANGITEEITARLVAIPELEVIGGTSAQRYGDREKTAREIGRELGVDYVLDGSVRWERSGQGTARVRVTPQLVRTADQAHVWAQVYDEPVDEVFQVQSDIAARVVAVLDVALPEPEQTVPTRNFEAYDHYLRGIDYERRGSDDARAMSAAERMYERAVALDSSFALAYAKLSRLHSRSYLFYYDRTAKRLELARWAVDRALALAPDLPEAHHALAAYHFLGQHDYERALQELAVVEAARPSDPEVFVARGQLRVRQGKFREGLPEYERAWRLDPGSAGVINLYAQVHDLLRDFPQADSLYDRALALAPDRPGLYFWKAWLYLRWDGTSRRARAVLDQGRRAGANRAAQVVLVRVLVELADRRYEEAIRILSTDAPEVIEGQARYFPKALLLAQAYGLVGRREQERAYYDSARTLLAARVAERPDDARMRGALGIAYAGLGRRQDAIREGERGVALLPVSREAYQGYYRVLDLARVYTMVGDHDAAVDRLSYLLSIPGHLTVAWLRADPTWDPLSGHRRFQSLVGGHQPRAESP